MEAGVKQALMILLGVAGLTAPPAFAADAPAGGSAISIGSLLAAGYEVKSVTSISNDDQKVIWPNDPVGPYVLIVLQKGPSVASCIVGTGAVVSVSPTQLAQTNICKKR